MLVASRFFKKPVYPIYELADPFVFFFELSLVARIVRFASKLSQAGLVDLQSRFETFDRCCFFSLRDLALHHRDEFFAIGTSITV